jgi:L-ascorbate metabolism protein UlaG (beta-lactamase superfamily)
VKLSVVALFVLMLLTPAQRPRLEARFIGQMAFAITDGSVTVMTDFPYQLGYAGAPRFESGEVRSTPNTLALITHTHADHWEPQLFAGTNWKVLAPADATKGIAADRVVAPSPRVSFGPVEIEPLETPHARIGHYSYLVTWHGRRLYFTGDTDSIDALVAARNLDVAFVSPWLFRSIVKAGARVDSKLVVIYHHEMGQDVPGCDLKCVVPRQGYTLRIE